LVALTGTAWPDLAVAAIMALLFLGSASQIVRQSIGELRGAGERQVSVVG
jgi:Co/Zn/Cd efflux system component